MEYTRFVELRRPVCEELEKGLETARRRPRELSYDDLERLAERYRQVLHDHALARSRFPGTAMARRLERLALEGTHWLQRDTGEHLPTLRRFLTRSFPEAVRQVLPEAGLMAALFLVAMIFGFTLATAEPGLGIAFVGKERVAELQRGELWTESIFAAVPGSAISGVIAANNMMVAVIGWAGGALFGLGAVYTALVNGLMLGSVLALTARYAMLDRLLDFVSAHGPLEISLILLTSAAGMHIGRALLVADDRPRGEVLRAAGRAAVVVLIGCLPWILLLGFIEGYVSPLPEVPTAAKLALGLALEALFVFVVWSPTLFRRGSS